MAQFDIDNAKEIIASGDQSRIDGMLADIARHLRTKKYGLVFEQGGGGSSNSAFETEQVVDDYRENIPYPVYRDDLSLNGDKFDGNMLLEGDNYVWLKVLEQTHRGKIDVIYIDPPYNTGNKDFVYNDTFVGNDDYFRHSKWLGFMDKRLRIARDMLSDAGIILISIDDNEQAYLKCLCDEIFHEENFICQFIWNKKTGGGGTGNTNYLPIQQHEYILCYAKSVSNASFNLDPYMEQEQLRTFKYSDGDRKYSLVRLDQTSLTYSPTLDYVIKDNDGNEYRPQHIDNEHPNAVWRWSKERVARDFNQLIFQNGHVYTKNYFRGGQNAKTILFDKRFGRTSHGKKDLYAIGLNASGLYPKPVILLKYLFQLTTDKNSTILDFFAGSGTTAQAVEELNIDDGGNRRWIVCTSNESDICRSITKPRIDTVITGIRQDGTQYSDGIDSSYAYLQYKTLPRTSNIERNRRAFLVPKIVDALIMMHHGVCKLESDETHKAFVYACDDVAIVALFGDPSVDDVIAVLPENGVTTRIAYVPDGCSALLSDAPDGINVVGMSELVTNTYLS